MTATSIIAAIIAAIKAVPIIDSWFQQLIAAWMNGQSTATLSAIADAAALAARATSDVERYAASAKWQQALSRPRQLP